MNEKRTLSEGVPAIFELDCDLVVKSINDSFISIVGGSQAQFVGQSLEEILGDDIRAQVVELIKSLDREQASKSFSFKRKDKGPGSNLWFECIINAEFNHLQKLTGYKGYLREITYHRLEQQLSLKMNRILSSQKSFVFDFSFTRGGVIFVSPTVEHILGYQQSDFYQDDEFLINIISEEYRTTFQSHLKQISEDDTATILIKAIAANGKERWLDIDMSVILGENNKPIGCFCIAKDVTAYKTSLTIHEGVLSTSLGAILVLKPLYSTDTIIDFELIMANRMAQDYFKLDGDGRGLSLLRDIKTWEDNNEIYELIINASKDSQTHEIQKYPLQIKGEQYYFKLVADSLGNNIVLTFQNITKQVEYEGRLQEIMADYERVFNNTSDAIFLLEVKDGSNYTYLRSNKIYEKITKYSAEEIRGQSPVELFGEKIGQQLISNYELCLSEQKTVNIDEEVSLPHGDYHFVTTLNPVFEGDKVRYISGISRDMTEIYKKEKALLDSEERFKDLFDNANDLIQSVDARGNFLYTNPAWHRTLEYSETDLKSMTIFDVIHPDCLDSCQNYFHKIMAGEEIEGIIADLVAKSGKKVTVEGNSSCLIVNGKPEATRTIFRDITERQLAEAAILESQESLEYLASFQNALVEMALEFININVDDIDQAVERSLELVGRFIHVDRAYLYDYDWDNRRAIKLHEWTKRKAVNDNAELENTITFESIADWVNLHTKGLQLSISNKENLHHALSEMTQFHISLPLMDGDVCMGFIGFDSFDDAFALNDEEIRLLKILAELIANAWIRERYEKDLLLTKELAEEATVTKSRFLANMSHEIRTPMNGVIGFLDLLSRTSMNDEQVNYLNQAQTASDMLLHVLNDVLDFSKIEADKLNIESRRFDVREIVENTVLLLAPNAFHKELELNLYIAPNINDYYYGDPGRIRQILSNLLNNAIKFTNEGEINISVTLEDVSTTHSTVIFKFEDTGIGMDENTKSKLFEPFEQADNSATREYGGSGLGLTISQRLAKMMGGIIEVESSIGKGSIFTLRLKFEKADSPEILEKVDLSVLRKQRILAVDDNENNRTILKSYLEFAGCQVDLADSGEKAISMLFQSSQVGRPYTLAILDQQMPGMDGLQLAQIILAVPEVRSTKLVMLTSMVTNTEFEKNYRGFSGYLTKPIKRNDLLASLVEILSSEQSETSQNQEVQNSQRQSTGQLNGAKVLIVEDQKVNAKLLINYLKGYKLDIDVAVNGQEALDCIQTKSFDLILMDCQMPIMDGFSATKEIRKMEKDSNTHVPIIALTAYAMEGDRERCIAAGMDDYLSKPINLDALIEKIKYHLGVSKSSKKEQEANIKSNNEIDVVDSKLSIINNFIRQTGMDEKSAVEIFDLFFESVPSTLEQIEKELDNEDWVKVAKLAHKIKGTAGNLMVNKFFELALQLEKAAKSYDKEACNDTLQQLLVYWKSINI